MGDQEGKPLVDILPQRVLIEWLDSGQVPMQKIATFLSMSKKTVTSLKYGRIKMNKKQQWKLSLAYAYFRDHSDYEVKIQQDTIEKRECDAKLAWLKKKYEHIGKMLISPSYEVTYDYAIIMLGKAEFYFEELFRGIMLDKIAASRIPLTLFDKYTLERCYDQMKEKGII